VTKTVGSIIAFLALGVLLVVGSSIKHPIVALQLALAEPPASLPVPVDGVRPSALRNSWRAPRDGGRHHQGIDIFARPGTPVRSTTEGIVIRLDKTG
jgi:murein DD-endopeptidase MepM/ murein hydrolase activator NlpD